MFFWLSAADVAELVDALDLGSSIERCGSSSLPVRTILFFQAQVYKPRFSSPGFQAQAPAQAPVQALAQVLPS